MLEQFAAVKQQQQQAYECFSTRVLLLDASVARVPLGAAVAAAELSCARGCLATPCSCLSFVLVALE